MCIIDLSFQRSPLDREQMFVNTPGSTGIQDVQGWSVIVCNYIMQSQSAYVSVNMFQLIYD